MVKLKGVVRLKVAGKGLGVRFDRYFVCCGVVGYVPSAFSAAGGSHSLPLLLL